MDFSELARKSAEFVANINFHIAAAVNANADDMVKLNISQMLNSKLSTGKVIMPKYSKAYAKRKGFKKPNLKVTGDFQDEMLFTASGQQYEIFSTDEKTGWLVDMYTDKIFGIAPDNQAKAQSMNDKTFIELYFKWLRQ